MLMDVYKNKATGKYFICVEEAEMDNESALLITPLGEIKPLNLRLFHEQEALDVDFLLARGLISKQQVEVYHSLAID